ncbi:MAG: dCTP deaminase domain-containing protein [Candidatus Bathyarchaeia archaeon]
MFLNSDSIRSLCDSEGLITGAKDLTFIEGATYDFRLGKVFVPDPNWDNVPFFGFAPNSNDEIRMLPPLVEISPDKDDVYHLSYNGRYIIQSVENFKLPDRIGALVSFKSSYSVALTSLSGTFCHPGFDGKIKAMLEVYNPRGIMVSRNYRIGVIKFFWHEEGSCDLYCGIWKGDKITTGGRVERGF